MSSERLIPVCGVSGFGFAISRTAIVIPPASNGGPSNPAITRLNGRRILGKYTFDIMLALLTMLIEAEFNVDAKKVQRIRVV